MTENHKCPNCGNEQFEEVSPTTLKCRQCGTSVLRPIVQQQTHQQTYQEQTQQPVYVENHMTKAILCTLFCFMPFGIMAIFNASAVNMLVAQGQIQAAQAKAADADKLANWAIAVPLVIIGTIAAISLVLAS